MTDAVRFRRRVLAYYRRYGRRFPWRETDDPYRLLVSEFMLQQTQAERVVVPYTSFVSRFRAVADLAGADRADVLRLWSGLGYNRRAVALHRSAAQIVSRFQSVVPGLDDELRSLPGVGPSTAGAVRAFGFGLPAIILETNIRRALLHDFYPDQDSVTDAVLVPVLETVLDRTDPRTWYWALMDYGAALGRNRTNPNRRSAHYSKQGRFEGSNRQQRGRIVSALAVRGPLTTETLAERVGATAPADRDRLRRNLRSLAADGVLEQVDDTVRLASGRENAEEA